MEATEQESTAPTPAGIRWGLSLLGGLLVAFFWHPMARLPLWHDDWKALYDARSALSRHESWYSAFAISDDPGVFWRPLSVTLHWRTIATFFQINPLASHIINLILLVAACAAVGNLACTIANQLTPFTSRRAWFLTPMFYGMHGAIFLPVAWASGAQELYALLFSALALKGFGVWGLGFGKTDQSRLSEKLWAISCPILLALALLSKESAAVLPALAVVLMWMLGKRPKGFALPIACAIVWIAWFLLRLQRVAPVPAGSPYSYHFGFNIVRNFFSLALFSINLPREAPQIAVLTRTWWVIVWGAACVGLQLVWIFRLMKSAALPRRTMIALGVFWLAGILPVLPLAWNCYPYYALTGLMAYAILVAVAFHGKERSKRSRVFAACALVSSLLLSIGQWLLPFPAPIASTNWGATQLFHLSQNRSQDSTREKYHLVIEDERRFGALGNEYGLAFALNVPAGHFVLPPKPCEDCDFEILVPADGDVTVTAIK